MILVDDFLTRRWWDHDPTNHGLGYNIPLDYDDAPVAPELAMVQEIHRRGIPFMVFMVGFVLEMPRLDVQDAIAWLVVNEIKIAGHGYYHTKVDHDAEYAPWAERTMTALKRVGQGPPYLWRYPRHEQVNVAHVREVGFELVPYDYFLDPDLHLHRSLSVLQGHEHHNAWCHSVYLTRIFEHERRQ